MKLDPIEIHTSDRQLWRRCRRKFGFASQLTQNLVRADSDSVPLWQGSGFHFGLEDYHGRRYWPSASSAFDEYVRATERERPPEWREAAEQTVGMLDYYTDDWLARHNLGWQTLILDGEPQVEVAVKIDITNLLTRAARLAIKGRTVLYVTTFDRVVLDDEARLWGVDYKTTKAFDYLNLETSPQVIAYDWAMDVFYEGLAVEGMLWQQHKKAVPVEPKLVYEGTKREGLSTAENQPTTWHIYRKEVLSRYGTIPERYETFLKFLAMQEGELSDPFIRIDKLHRNNEQRRAEQNHIGMEVSEMLTYGAFPVYPNFTRDCSWDCAFKVPCLAMDDGSDVTYLMSSEYVTWQGYRDDWRQRIKYPKRKV